MYTDRRGLNKVYIVPELEEWEVKIELERRFCEIAERYADKIPTIEVFNEMFWDKWRNNIYCTDDFVLWTYKTAEKYFPNNKIGINNIVPTTSKKSLVFCIVCSFSHYICLS